MRNEYMRFFATGSSRNLLLKKFSRWSLQIYDTVSQCASLASYAITKPQTYMALRSLLRSSCTPSLCDRKLEIHVMKTAILNLGPGEENGNGLQRLSSQVPPILFVVYDNVHIFFKNIECIDFMIK